MVLKNIHQVIYRRFLFRVKDCFLSPGEPPDHAINYYVQCSTNVERRLEEFHTLLVDLTQTEEAMFNNIQAPARAEISSFTKNQKFDHQVVATPSKKQLNHYITLFNEFAKHKNIRGAETERLHAYHRNGILVISFIKQGHKYLCINFYRLTKERATNLHSFHLKHVLKHEYSQSHFGRAHRSLHWLDLMHFKNEGVHFYDFCGWYNGSDDSALLNINKFKEQFSSHKVVEYSGVIYKNKVLLFLKKLRQR